MRNRIIYCGLSLLGGALTGYGIDGTWRSAALYAGAALASAVGWMYHRG